MFSRSIQSYGSASGLPWTVATLASLPIALVNRQIYAWVGLDENHTYRLKTGIIVNLKLGAVVVDSYALTLVSKTTAVSGTTFADSLGAMDARNSATYASMSPAENAVDFRFFARTGASGSDHLSFVHIRPVPSVCACDSAELIVDSMTWESAGALSAAVPLVCYLGVRSQLVPPYR